MTKGTIAKLAKLKFMLKRWHAAASTSGRHGNARLIPSTDSCSDDEIVSTATAAVAHGGKADITDIDAIPKGMQAVLVGKSRRQYLISERLIDHPLLRVLVQRDEDTVVVACEVVLFEHLLWMLENGDQPAESLDELAEFYAC